MRRKSCRIQELVSRKGIRRRIGDGVRSLEIQD